MIYSNNLYLCEYSVCRLSSGVGTDAHYQQTKGQGQRAYSCDPDNTVTVTGFTAGTNFFAKQGATTCTSTLDSDNTTLTITNCKKDSEILVTYGSYADMETNALHGGTTVNAFKITCNEIAATGVNHTITNAFTASLSIDATPSTQPTYSVTSTLTPSSVTVGDPVTWTISYPSVYSLKIVSCSAYAGTNATGTALSLISAGGCSLSEQLVSDFNDSGSSAVATLEAFKFYSVNHVFLTCNVKVCPAAGAANCAVNKIRLYIEMNCNR
ncbi:uncharacterized protein LOC132755274 [Ruditapes philippinarum]|uniref:uncharacterized protein LOC132755274 n=1 Tax=Ruditapes philippinarum TaxID=129788 RepID=UPI00295AA2D1|nr:uncharacterized protein LOC132755274 [Ruditapes philippinarum]